MHRRIPYARFRHRRNRERHQAVPYLLTLLFLLAACTAPQMPPDTAATTEDGALVGRHFWEAVSFPAHMPCRTPVSLTCSAAGEGFTVEEVTVGTGGMTFVRVQFDDGSEGYLPYVVGTSRIAWTSEAPTAAARARQARLAAIGAEIEKMQRQYCSGDPLRIGMTEQEALRAWCFPDRTTSSETAKGTRDEWVYKGHGTLTFKDGRLIEIKRID